MREHRRPERSRIPARRLAGAAFQPGKQFHIWNAQAAPDQLDLLRVLAAESGHRGLGQPGRDTDAQFASDELEQCPASCLIQLIEPARKLSRQRCFAERGQGAHNFAEF